MLPDQTFFGDDRRPVRVVWQVADGEHTDGERTVDDDARRLRQETIMRVISWLATDAPSATVAGRRLLILAFFLKTGSAPKTQRALAEKLGVSEARISQAVKSFRRKLSQMCAN